ncbi:MAG: helix-turn-helix domain-containing protein [Alicyclobacillus sp.]|nr:helix-turn-helix domain-containing protein [Alicyclobacillus sp.]
MPEDIAVYESDELSLGDRLRILRKRRRMTQAQLGRGLVTPSMISQIESGKVAPSAALLKDLAKRLGVSPEYFAEGLSVRSEHLQTYRRGRALMERGDYAAALPLIEASLPHVRPVYRDEVLYSELATCYEHLGQLEQAANVYEQLVFSALERGEGTVAVQGYYSIGNMYRRAGQPNLARMYWQRGAGVLSRFPDLDLPLSVKLYYHLGRICYILKHDNVALLYLEKAVEAAERYEAWLDLAMIWHGMANVYLRTGSYELAYKFNSDAERMYQFVRNPRGMYQCKINYGIILNRSGQPAAALDYFNELLESDTDLVVRPNLFANVLAERATARLALGRVQDALTDAEQALSLAGTKLVELHAASVLAKAKLASGATEVAAKLARRALGNLGESAIEPEALNVHAELLSVLQQALLQLGRTDELVACAQAFARSLAMDPPRSEGAGEPLTL